MQKILKEDDRGTLVEVLSSVVDDVLSKRSKAFLEASSKFCGYDVSSTNKVQRTLQCFKGLSKLIREQIDLFAPSAMCIVLLHRAAEQTLRNEIDDKIEKVAKYQAKNNIQSQLGLEFTDREFKVLKLLKAPLDDLSDPLATMIFEKGDYYCFRSDQAVLALTKTRNTPEKIRQRFDNFLTAYRNESERVAYFIEKNIPELKELYERFCRRVELRISERCSLTLNLNRLL